MSTVTSKWKSRSLNRSQAIFECSYIKTSGLSEIRSLFGLPVFVWRPKGKSTIGWGGGGIAHWAFGEQDWLPAKGSRLVLNIDSWSLVDMLEGGCRGRLRWWVVVVADVSPVTGELQ